MSLLRRNQVIDIGGGAITTSGAVASTNTTPVLMPHTADALFLGCDLTAAATDVGDTLDVKVQTKIGDDWVDICYFTQMLGNGGAKFHGTKLLASAALTMADMNTALTAGNVRNMWGEYVRINYVIVDADADSAFTFRVFGMLI